MLQRSCVFAKFRLQPFETGKLVAFAADSILEKEAFRADNTQNKWVVFLLKLDSDDAC